MLEKNRGSLLYKSVLSIAIAGVLTPITYTSLVAEELGIISVESTTIDDKFESKRDEVSSIGVVGGEEIDVDRPKSVQDMLQRIPGITTEVQSGDSLKIHIRGVENQVYMGERPGVAVVIDGVPVFERTGRVNIDLDNIESIKVVKGGASYLFGDDALGGAVIITTKRGASNAGYRVDAEAGSFGYYKGLARAGFANETASGHIQVSRRHTDGYHDDSASTSDYVNGKLQYYIDDTSDLTFGMELSEREKNSHGAVTGHTAAKEDPKSKDIWSYNDYANNYNVDLQKFFLTYSKDVGATGNLMVNGYQYTDDTEYVSSPAGTDPTVYNYGNDYAQIQRGIKSEYRTGGEKLAWMAGLDLRANEYDNEVTFIDCLDMWAGAGCVPDTLYQDNVTDEAVQAIYGEVKFRASNKLVMTLNGRADHIDLDYTDRLDSTDNGSKSFDVPSWRLGGNYAMRNNLDLYANASTGFRTPTVRQLFTGSNSPTSRTDPNPDLEPEHSLNLELGLRTSTSMFNIPHELDVSVFQLDRKDYIQSTAGQYTTSSDNIYDNIGDVRNRGLELSLNSDINRKVSWDIAYTYLDAQYTRYDNFNLQTAPIAGACPPGSTPVYGRGPFNPPTNCLTSYDNAGNQVPRTPKHTVNLLLRGRPANDWVVTGELVYKSDYYADEINQEKIDSHSVFNLWVNYDRTFGRSNWMFFARIDNLFDEFYYNTARGYRDSNEDGVYDGEDLSLVVNPGRVYTAGLTVNF